MERVLTLQNVRSEKALMEVVPACPCPSFLGRRDVPIAQQNAVD